MKFRVQSLLQSLPCSRSLRVLGLHGITLALLGWFSAVFAHDPGLSTAQIVLFPDRIEIMAGFAPSDARFLIDPQAAAADPFGDLDFESARTRLVGAAATLWQVELDGIKLKPSQSSADLIAGDNLSLSIRFVIPRRFSAASFQSARLGELPAGHRQFVVVSDPQGLMLAKKLMSQKSRQLDVVIGGSDSASTAPAADSTPTWRGFLILGVEHIWTGYDHLLFLLALLVVCSSFRSIVTIISCFTLAHSLTLAAATLGLIEISARWVEPMIAASIIYVGLENLVRRGQEPRGRSLLTFAFGLIHGLGFASVLRDLGVGTAGSVSAPLVFFNLGVECGQIAIAAIVLPVIWRARRQPWFARQGVAVASTMITLLGCYWFAERLGWL
jgi:hydrogenase/urease accessory protein HupE